MKLSFLDILVHYKSLNLPRIGRFELDEVSAQLDEDENLIYPPYNQIRFHHISNSEIEFSEEIALYLHYNFGLPYERAVVLAKEQVELICSKMDETSIVLLTGLGRIFKAGSAKIHFIPDDLELLKEERKGYPVFELPVIEQETLIVAPVVAVEQEQPETIDSFEDKGETVAQSKVIQELNIPYESDEAISELLEDNKPNHRKTLWWTIPLSLIVLVLIAVWGILTFGNGKSKNTYRVQTMSSIENRINIEPLKEELLYPEDTFEEVEGIVYENLFSEGQDEMTAQVENDSNQEIEDVKPEQPIETNSEIPITPMKSLNPSISENDCFIIVGAFGQDKNVKKMVDALENYGHSVLIDKDIHLTRVGVLIPCDDPKLPELYTALKSEVNKDVWIMKKK